MFAWGKESFHDLVANIIYKYKKKRKKKKRIRQTDDSFLLLSFSLSLFLSNDTPCKLHALCAWVCMIILSSLDRKTFPHFFFIKSVLSLLIVTVVGSYNSSSSFKFLKCSILRLEQESIHTFICSISKHRSTNHFWQIDFLSCYYITPAPIIS